jgi:hypothetical protein
MSHAENVARGAALLDQKIPGWEHQINVASLDIGSCNDCIIGQLFGGYYPDRLDSLFNCRVYEDDYCKNRVEHGFTWDRYDDSNVAADQLTQCWKHEIYKRKNVYLTVC